MEQCGNSHPGFFWGKSFWWVLVRIGSAFMWGFFFADPIRILIFATKKKLTRPTFCWFLPAIRLRNIQIISNGLAGHCEQTKYLVAGHSCWALVSTSPPKFNIVPKKLPGSGIGSGEPLKFPQKKGGTSCNSCRPETIDAANTAAARLSLRKQAASQKGQLVLIPLLFREL